MKTCEMPRTARKAPSKIIGICSLCDLFTTMEACCHECGYPITDAAMKAWKRQERKEARNAAHSD